MQDPSIPTIAVPLKSALAQDLWGGGAERRESGSPYARYAYSYRFGAVGSGLISHDLMFP